MNLNYYKQIVCICLFLLSGLLPRTSIAQDSRNTTATDPARESSIAARAQQTVPDKKENVKGAVLDDVGEPLPGATVMVKGDAKKHTITNVNGKFELTGISTNAVLVISFLGYETQEVALNGRQELTVSMKLSATTLHDVVVTGIFNKAKESYTGAAVKISAEELKIAGNRSVVSSIVSLDPSFRISENINIGSDPNKLASITVRGASSLPTDIKDLQSTTENMQKSNQPLIVMDGFVVSLERLMDMDENIIESITLLKDANATAVYGTRGSNGVIVIITKTPQSGKLQVTYKGSLNIEAPDLSSYNLMNAHEKLAYEWAAGLYSTPNAIYDQELKDLYNQRLMDATRGVDTYWLKYPVHTGIGSRHSLNIEGGENTFRYGASLSYNNVVGAMKGSSRNTFNGGLTFIYKVKNFTFKNNLQVSLNKGTNSPYGNFSDYGKVNAYWTPYDEDGNVKKVLEDYYYMSLVRTNKVYNPLYNALLPSKNTNEYIDVLNNFSMEWNITPELFVRGQLGISTRRNRSDNYLSAEHTMFDGYVGDDYARKGRYIYDTGNSEHYEGMLTLNYAKTFNEKHQLVIGLGTTISEETGESYSIMAEGISMLTMDYLGAAKQYEKDGRPGASESIVRNAGFLLDLSYTYAQRYFVNFNGKLEGSSQFGANKQLAPFWSMGIGCNLHQESFLKGNTVLNQARVRLSYGITGLQDFPSYLANSSYQDFGGNSYQNEYGVYLKALGNPDLGWQKSYQYNLGVELQFFNYHWQLNVDVYNKLTKDLLADINLPTAGGFKNYKANVGEVENKGIEITTNVFVLKNHHGFTWSLGGTLAHNVNVVKKISNSLEAMNDELMKETNSSTAFLNPSFLFKEGESINTIYAVKSKGIDPGTGREVFITADGTETFVWSAKDQVACGTTDPIINGTLNTVVRYKGISLGAYFSYRYGGQVYNDALANKVENIFPYNNADKRAYYDRWKVPGDQAMFKSVKDFTSTRVTSRFVMDNNNFSLQSLSLGYEFPSAWIKRNLAMEYLSVTGYLEDIFYLSTVRRERGLEYPFSRKFSISLTARF